MPFVNGLHQSLHCLKLHYIWDPLCFIFSFFFLLLSVNSTIATELSALSRVHCLLFFPHYRWRHSIYARTVSLLRLISTLLIQSKLVSGPFGQRYVHRIDLCHSQEENKCPTTYERLRAYCSHTVVDAADHKK